MGPRSQVLVSKSWILGVGFWSFVTIHSVIITKCDKKLLQRVAGITKCDNITKFDRKLLQSVASITKCDKKLLQSMPGVTKYDNYYKVRRNVSRSK